MSLIMPSNKMTSNMAEHKARGTSGEDFGSNDGTTQKGDRFNFPCSDRKFLGSRDFNDGTHKEFYNATNNGYKFSFYTCHCTHDDKNILATGDNYSGSTGYHVHILFFHGHQSIDFMQNNRNTLGVTFEEVNKKCINETTPPTTTSKTFKAVREGKSQDNGTFYFDEKYYNDFKDGKQSASAVDTNGNTWAKDTTWTKVYSPSGSSSSVKEMTSYYDGGWHKEPSSGYIPFKSNDSALVKESDTTKYGSGAYRLTVAKSGWQANTRFK